MYSRPTALSTYRLSQLGITHVVNVAQSPIISQYPPSPSNTIMQDWGAIGGFVRTSQVGRVEYPFSDPISIINYINKVILFHFDFVFFLFRPASSMKAYYNHVGIEFMGIPAQDTFTFNLSRYFYPAADFIDKVLLSGGNDY